MKTPNAAYRRSVLKGPLGILVTILLHSATATGELASLVNPPFSPHKSNFTHRQNICHRYDMFRAGNIELRDALSGMALQPVILPDELYFHYDSDRGIDPNDPGIIAELMDALAARANFTWRHSFAIMEAPQDVNQTWTDILFRGIENFDVAVYFWDQSVERMEKGVAFIEPWFDGSVILIDQSDPPENVNTIQWFNWTSPFESAVWALTIFTILLSALVYQLIEFLNDEREDRSLWQWFSDNLYLSSLNFTQNFEYAPNSVAGRIFGVSMGMWALVMTATYTANLASLFVQEKRPALVVDSIDQAILLEIPICTWGSTNSDLFIQEKYPGAKRKPKATELEAYQALKQGECGLYTAYKDSWLGYKEMSQYNPECDLEWVGRVVTTIKSGLAVKADAGHLCTSLIRDVLNLHMAELIMDGVLEKIWTKHRAITKDQDCETQDSAGDQRFLKGSGTNSITSHRKLKAAGSSGAAAKMSSGSNNSSLTLRQMMGTFAFHWVSMAVAITISLLANFYEKWRRRQHEGDELEESVRLVYRKHGPIVGMPPRVNTYSSRNMDANRGEMGRSASRMIIRNMDTSRGELGNSASQRRRGTAKSNNNNQIKQPPETTLGAAATNEDDATPNNVRFRVSNYDWSPELQLESGNKSNGQNIQERPLQTPECRRLYAELSQQQQDLSLQMNSVLILLQKMQEKQELGPRLNPNLHTKEAANKAELAGIDKHIAELNNELVHAKAALGHRD